MKKPLSLLALATLVTGALLVSGCGMFHSSKAWETAKQESPLEIPPGLDRPSTSDALVVPPPGANQEASEGHRAATNGGQVSDGFVLKDTVDSTYQRVGRVLEHGDLGQVVSHDDAAHSYTLNVASVAQQKKPGFFKRLFHRGKRGAADSAAASNQVVISVTGSGSDSSEVRAEGGATAVGQVVDGLKSRLGG